MPCQEKGTKRHAEGINSHDTQTAPPRKKWRTEAKASESESGSGDLDDPLNGQDEQEVVGRVSKPVKARHDQTSPSLQRPPVVSSFRFSRLLLADAQVQDAIALPIYVT